MTTGQYSRRILETQTVSLPLVTVLATDGDRSFIEESEKVIQSGHIYTASFGDVCDVWLDVPLLVNT